MGLILDLVCGNLTGGGVSLPLLPELDVSHAMMSGK